ncbi:hypothetical protein B6U70_01650 [Euryarchaeota archaeon ex4484_162]|nr:MAG: hypothetical protein B6U70_01650 [Euryarchaeota archaeon ex4484_162]RLF28974.1 MAG: hypothetical protein DRN05_02730 [Thermoplasmata archaeon]
MIKGLTASILAVLVIIGVVLGILHFFGIILSFLNWLAVTLAVGIIVATLISIAIIAIFAIILFFAFFYYFAEKKTEIIPGEYKLSEEKGKTSKKFLKHIIFLLLFFLL